MSPSAFGKRKRSYSGETFCIFDRIINAQRRERPGIAQKFITIDRRNIVTSPCYYDLVPIVFCREDQAATTVFGRIGKSENTFVIIPNVYALDKGAGVTSIYTDACLCWQPSVSRFQEFQR